MVTKNGDGRIVLWGNEKEGKLGETFERDSEEGAAAT